MKRTAYLLIQDAQGKFLLVRRSNNCQNHKGVWEFPGGVIDEDEPPIESLQRRVREEIGIDFTLPTGITESQWTCVKDSIEYAFYAWRASDSLEVHLDKEHAECKWFSFTETRKTSDLMAPHREYLERFWHRQQITAYEQELTSSLYAFESTLKAVLERLRDRWAPLAIVQARAKTLSSFAEKCLRKADKYDDPVHQLTDLCGGRIVTTTIDEAETICRQIQKLFPIDEYDDTGKRHAISAFGYLSVHFLIHFPKDMTEVLGIPIPDAIKDRKVEIQVRTLLQHAHSEVTHDRLYKAGYKPPQYSEREAARVAAVLESADQEFARFVAKLDTYVRHYAAYLPAEKRRREIADIKLILAHESKPSKKPALAMRIARLARAAWDWQEVVSALDPFSELPCPEAPCIHMELGNALCRLHRDAHCGPTFTRGVALLRSVADPDGSFMDAANSPTSSSNQLEPCAGTASLEPDERIRRAAAFAWLGSALSKIDGNRTEARAFLGQAVQLTPDDPYHFVAFVELDIMASGLDRHLDLLAPALRQSAGRCLEHIQAGIELTRAWFTLGKIRLLLRDELSAIEACCLAVKHAENAAPLVDFHRSLDHLKDAIELQNPAIKRLIATVEVFTKVREYRQNTSGAAFDWEPLKSLYPYSKNDRILILAGTTKELSEDRRQAYETHLDKMLKGFDGTVLSGGTTAGVCGLLARAASRLNASGDAHINLVGYTPHTLPSGASLDPAYKPVRIPKSDQFSLLEPLQMWTDLMLSGIDPSQVTLLSLGGGCLSAAELALAWAFGARSAVLDDGSKASMRFNAMFEPVAGSVTRGIVLPDDPATVQALLAFRIPTNDSTWEEQWEKPGQAVHEAYLREQSKYPSKSNLLPWPLLRDDFKHSNRHQAACSVIILEQSGFRVEKTELRPDDIQPIEFMPAEMESMAEREHGRWNVERFNSGWRYGEKKDEEKKISPYLVAWPKLPPKIQQYDLDAVQTWPRILAQAGLIIKRS